MKKILIGLLAAATLVACDKGADVDLSKDQIKATLEKTIPGIEKIDTVKDTPIKGIYEVDMGRKVFYVDGSAKYVMFGNLIDITTKKNLTEDAVAKLSTVDFSKIPLDLAVKDVIGDGSRKIVVFTDPDCPYCQMFEKEVVPGLKNVTIYSFLFPLPIHPNAMSDSKKIWCAKDRLASWKAWMVSKTALPADTSCDTSGLDAGIKYATDVVQVSGTPTIILQDGSLLPGMMPADQLNAKLDELSGTKTVASAAK